jgi:hypothetical protein
LHPDRILTRATAVVTGSTEGTMNTRQLITPVRRTLSSVPPMRTLTQLGATAALGWAGLARSQGRAGTRSALVAVGALLGAGAALLFAPSSGAHLRSRLGKGAGGTIGGALGKLLGGQAGAHPIRTAELVEKTQEVLGSKEA